MPQRGHENLVARKPPPEIAEHHVALVPILSLITDQQPDIATIARLLDEAICAAYVRGFEAGQKQARRADERERSERRDYE